MQMLICFVFVYLVNTWGSEYAKTKGSWTMPAPTIICFAEYNPS